MTRVTKSPAEFWIKFPFSSVSILESEKEEHITKIKEQDETIHTAWYVIGPRKELKEHTKDATTLIVAQRIGTIKNADKIIVLDNGEVVGIGKHKELLKTCKVYKEIGLSQLTKEELENE